MEELIILVDKEDREIGYGEKMDIHVKEQLHRAFSIFIYDWNHKKMLIQKRAEGKYHSGGKWSNACCSHPRKGEIMEEALSRRLHEELGFDMPERLKIVSTPDTSLFKDGGSICEAGKFTYFAQFDGLAEHEIDHVFVYHPTAEQIRTMKCDPEEIGEFQWIDLSELKMWTANVPEDFSAWFIPALKLACKIIEKEEVMLVYFGY